MIRTRSVPHRNLPKRYTVPKLRLQAPDDFLLERFDPTEPRLMIDCLIVESARSLAPFLASGAGSGYWVRGGVEDFAKARRRGSM